MLTQIVLPQEVWDDWLNALKTREPRALELAFALQLSLPADAENAITQAHARFVDDATMLEISAEMRDLLGYAHEKYAALTRGQFERVEVGNSNVLAFERRTDDERVLVVNNLTLHTQPIKFREYVDKAGWDILNRVEFIFPPRAQLEAYEFLWLLVE